MKNLLIPPFSHDAAQAAQQHLDALAKVPGSLGLMEDLAVRLAGITGNTAPAFPHKSLVLFAGDHDIAQQGVSTAPQAVTEALVRLYLEGGGAINAYCRTANADFTVVDAGLKNDLALDGLLQAKVIHGARDFSTAAAMSRDEAAACIQLGIDMARAEAERGVDLLAAGEVGIGNTSPSSAIAAVMTGHPVEEVTGAGTGITPEKVRFKAALIRRGIELNKPDPADALDVLAKVGGAEIGAMAGLMLGGAELRIPVIVDGFIAGAAASIAIGLNPDVRHMLVGSHSSCEAGHRILMDHLGIPTYFDFHLRLGEGTGAVLMFPIIDSAVRILTEMKLLKDI